MNSGVGLKNMTIREDIKKQKKPYMISIWICGILFISASVGLIAFIKLVLKAETTLQIVILMIISVAYLGGGIGGIVANIMLVLKVRCPKCKKRLKGGGWKWEYCPFCAVYCKCR